MAYKNFDEFWKANEAQFARWEPQDIAALAFVYGEVCGINYARERVNESLVPFGLGVSKRVEVGNA